MPYGNDPRWKWRKRVRGESGRVAQPAMAVMRSTLGKHNAPEPDPPRRCPMLPIPAGIRRTPSLIAQAGAGLYRVMKERVDGVLEWMKYTVGAYRQLTQRWQERRAPTQTPPRTRLPSTPPRPGTPRGDLAREQSSPAVERAKEVMCAGDCDHTTAAITTSKDAMATHSHLHSAPPHTGAIRAKGREHSTASAITGVNGNAPRTQLPSAEARMRWRRR